MIVNMQFVLSLSAVIQICLLTQVRPLPNEVEWTFDPSINKSKQEVHVGVNDRPIDEAVRASLNFLVEYGREPVKETAVVSRSKPK